MTSLDTTSTAPGHASHLMALDWAGLVVGLGPTLDSGIRPVCAGARRPALILGPTQIGKTSCIVIPTVLTAPGAVVSTSTKPDVLRATLSWRSQMGTCYLFDLTGESDVGEAATELRWSPVTGCEDHDRAEDVAEAIASAARPFARNTEASHWVDRSKAWLAPVLHAAALSGANMASVADWVWRHEIREVQAILSAMSGSDIARASLSGILKTDERERSGILSTAAGLLSAYRSERVLRAACNPNFDADHFAASYDTVYITAPADKQEQLAPLIVALLDQIKNAVYRRRSRNPTSAPVVFALDEAANIAPLPKLPQIASEGAGQGLVLLASMQDISQARFRWGEQADGFVTLFPVSVFFPGIADPRTLELLSQLGGETMVPMVSTNVPSSLAALTGKGFASTTHSYTWRRRLPVDAISEGTRGTALCRVAGQPLRHVMTMPWDQVPEWARRGT